MRAQEPRTRATRKGSRHGVLSAAGWYDVAVAIKAETSDKRYGELEAIYAAHAERLKVDIMSIRRILTGYVNLQQIAAHDPKRAVRMRTISVTTVNAIARWASYNHADALAAADRHEAGLITGRALIDEKASARKRHAASMTSAEERRQTHELHAMDAAYLRLLPTWSSNGVDPYAHTGRSPFAKAFRHKGTNETCLVMIPSFEDVERGDREKRVTVFLTAIGASAMGHRVLVMAPDGSRLATDIASWLSADDPSEGRVEVATFDPRHSG